MGLGFLCQYGARVHLLSFVGGLAIARTMRFVLTSRHSIGATKRATKARATEVYKTWEIDYPHF